MKILDRYILATFLKNYLISFMVLVGLYVVMDMVMQFDELAENQTVTETGMQSALGMLLITGDYYFHQMFVFFVHLSAMIPVVAATFTLVRLVRFNELTAMLAAGVPLLRIAAPIVIASLILNALLLVDQELIIPEIIPKLVRKHDQIRQDSGPSFPVYSMRDNANGLLVAARFHPATSTTNAYMEHIDVIERDAERQPVSHIVADRADWDPRAQQWNLTNGVHTTGLAPQDRHRTHKPIAIYDSSITPDEIALYHSGNYVQLLSTDKINQLLQRPQSYGTLALQRVKHFRFTQPLANIIILLLAAACVLTREPGQLKNGIVKSSVFTGACMATIFIAQNLAGQPPNETWINTWPALMAWLPLIIFGPVAVWLLDRVKT